MPAKQKVYSINRGFAAVVERDGKQRKEYFTVRDTARLKDVPEKKLKELVAAGTITAHDSEEEVPVHSVPVAPEA